MYACISIGDFDKTSFFYYTNGNCGAPKSQKCAYNKSVYEYEKLFPNEMGKLTLASPMISSERLISKEAASVSTVSFHEKFGPIILVKTQEQAPKCTQVDFTVKSKQFCNLFFECKDSKLSSFVCIDGSTGKLNGIFDETINSCKPYNQTQCESDSVYKPDQQDISNENTADSPETLKGETFRTNSSFSCQGRQNGYYESEWCNVYFQCLAGKRIDTRCSSSLNSNPDYDLWWVYQNQTYDPSSPMKMKGFDGQARCEWPCKVKCQKKIWVDTESNNISHENILTIDKQLGHECPLNETANVKSSSDKFSHEDLKNADPSGFICNNRIGVFSDPLFCNIFHECHINGKKSFSCKVTETDKIALFDPESKKCVSKSEGFGQCNGLIYDNKFLYEPALKNLPENFEKCSESGVFNAVDGSTSYCDLFYWCRAAQEMPIFFYCDISYLSKEAAVFNIESKQCELKQGQVCSAGQQIYSDTLKLKMSFAEVKNGNDSSKSKIAKNELSDDFDPAPKYTEIQPSLFKTKFKCEPNASGYYADTDFCDIFHYCFSNGKFKTYACSALTNEYQLWWSYDADKPRHAVIIFFWLFFSF